ncbi:MAG TPA: TolC family protein, partial [Planctomycetia bacterium]|nr:TolC family protein [Planctomycetia bacterium]
MFELSFAIALLAQTGARPPSPAPTTPAPLQPAPDPGWTLDRLVQTALERNPKLAQGAFAVDAARGQAVQAGLYPNPTLVITGDELGDRTGAQGIWSAPQFNQEIVTGGKLRLQRAAASKDVDRAGADLAARRYALLGAVRLAYFDALALQTRIEILAELVGVAEKSVEQTAALYKATLVARLDVVQLETELERVRADHEAAERELGPALRKLAAIVGLPNIPARRVEGVLSAAVPAYDLDAIQERATSTHPEVVSAQAASERARLALARAQAQPVPNVTLSAGYVRQNQNRSSDWMVG